MCDLYVLSVFFVILLHQKERRKEERVGKNVQELLEDRKQNEWPLQMQLQRQVQVQSR